MNKKGENKKFSPCIFSPKNRRGSHIDVILSFIIFISFIVFFYAMIQPNIISKADKTAFLNYMGGELIKNLTGAEINTISFQVNPSYLHSCLQLVDFTGSAEISSMNLVLKNLTGTAFTAYKSGNDLYISMNPDQNTRFFKAYYSPNFNPVGDWGLFSSECNFLLGYETSDYSINKKENYTSIYIWEDRINSLIDTYNNNYDSLKSQFNIPPKDNFGFGFIYQNQTTITTDKTAPTTANTYSGTFPVAYISANNNLEAGNLIVKVW